MNTRAQAPLLAAALAVLAAAPALAADPPPAGGLADLVPPRALSLGGGVGVISGIDGLFVNPAAPAARKRYAVETLFAIDRRGGTTVAKYLGAGVVDSQSAAPVTGAFAYLRSMEDPQKGNLFVGELAGPISERLYLGLSARYVAVKGTEKVDAVSGDVGLLWEPSDGFTIGAAGYNLVPTGHEQVLPRGAGAGLAIGSDTGFKLTADWHGDFDRNHKTTNRYGLGAEVLLGNMFPVRAGWLKDDTLDTSWWCAGAGIITQGGVGIDVGYRQSLTWPDARQVTVTLKAAFLDF